MKRSLPITALALLFAAAAPAAEKPPSPTVALGGGGYIRYLHLDLSRWENPRGRSLPQRDLAVCGGRVCASGPIGPDSLRWRLGAFLDWGSVGSYDDDWDEELNELQLALAGVGLTSGVSWAPGPVGASAELNLGGDWILTEYKRAELDNDWDVYERRDTALFRLEPILSLDVRLSSIFVLRLHGGWSFLWGQGEQVGGFTGGVAADFGAWM